MMGLYKLRKVSDEKESGILEKVKTDLIDYEKDFENWLENSPVVLLDDDSESTVLWIGRQVNARVGDVGKYPDLIGIDSNGDLVIVELKKGKTPREVVAQILEYASWGASLTYDDLNAITQGYCSNDKDLCGKDLLEIFRNVFLPESEEEEDIHFNVNQKLYIVAEEISPIVKQVAMHLRNKYNVDIYCMEYEVLKTQQGEYFISTEKILGYDEIKNNNTVTSKNINVNERWNEPIKIKTVISNAVSKLTGGRKDFSFTTGDIYNELIKEYPVIKKNTVGCQIIQNCVNHTSRKHYPSGQMDLYFRIDKGKFRLYVAETDGKWDWEGKIVN